MADNTTTSKEIKQQNTAEIEAFQQDVELQNYLGRVENGELTPEELESRNAALDFLGVPHK